MSDPKRKEFSRYEIAKYWSSAPSGFTYKDKELTVFQYLDLCLEEGTCFACRFNKDWLRSSSPSGNLSDEKVLKKIWDRTGLIRHHIIPLDVGGKDEVNNIALLCVDCHNVVPHIKLSLNEFLRWSKSRLSFYQRKYLEYTNALKAVMDYQFDSDEERERFGEFIIRQGFKEVDEIYSRRADDITHNGGRVSMDQVALLFAQEFKWNSYKQLIEKHPEIKIKEGIFKNLIEKNTPIQEVKEILEIDDHICSYFQDRLGY